MRFGAHTENHRILPRLPRAGARAEVLGSVAAVARLVERPSAAFAYPNGQPQDLDEHVIAVVRESGIRYGLTTDPGPFVVGSDPHRVPRYQMGADEQRPRFAWRAHHVGHALRPRGAW